MDIPGYIYKDAWNKLASAFGEHMQQEELDLMDAVLASVIFDGLERKEIAEDKIDASPSSESQLRSRTYSSYRSLL